VSLKELASWLKRGQYDQFLMEICPRRKYTHKIWPFIDGHNTKAVYERKEEEGSDKIDQASTERRLEPRAV
jgi:hypothetical protein